MPQGNPSPKAVQDAITAVLNAEWFGYLYERWQDEAEYEDFEDYKKKFAELSKFQLIRAKKRPFSFVFKVPAFPEATYEIKMGARSGAWRRLS